MYNGYYKYKGEAMKTKAKQYYLRKCDGCNKGMSQGIYLYDEYYFCGEECLNANYIRLNIIFEIFVFNSNGLIENSYQSTYSNWLEWVNKNDNYEHYGVFEYYNGIAEWYKGDDWGYLFDEHGEEIDIENVDEEEIVEGE